MLQHDMAGRSLEAKCDSPTIGRRECARHSGKGPFLSKCAQSQADYHWRPHPWGPSAPRRRHDPGREFVRANGSTNTVMTSWKVTPCLAPLLAAFAGSQSNSIRMGHSSRRNARCWSEANSASSLARWTRWWALSLSISATRAAKAHCKSNGGLMRSQLTQDCQVNILLCKLRRIAFEGGLNKREPLLNEFCSYVVLINRSISSCIFLLTGRVLI